ncbi:MAG: DNA polymerase III subunit gamma/tau [Bacteroidota bacterium]
MSNFVVSARKYRPDRFEDVVGQEHVTLTLKNALRNDHLAHAFLFCGPRGVGKTTCARILAKTLNCQNNATDFEPCGTCSSCEAFTENASFNITELDAASNNSVEHIRALIEQVRFQPQQGKYKVFIIDEVHMLSSQAFNAFLKTLEEPPAYAIFILATTEKHKILPTILSRCQIFDFRRIQIPRMVEHLQAICATEQIAAEENALHIIAQKADGALRDALSIFDRIVSFSGKHIKYNDVISSLNVLDYDYYFKIVDAFLIEDRARIMNLFDDIINNGFEPDIFLVGLAEHLRNILVCKDSATLQLLQVSQSLRERYQQQAQLTQASFILTALSLASDCDVHYKMARNKRLHVEMCLLKMTHINRAIDLSKQHFSVPNGAGKKKPLNPETKQTTNGTAIAVEHPKTPVSPEKRAESQTPVSAVVRESKVEMVVMDAPPEPVTTKPKLRRSNKHSVVSIKNLTTLAAEVKEAENVVVEQEKPLDLTLIKSTWMQHADGVESGSLKSALKNTGLAIAEDKIIAKISSKLAENLIRQERILLEKLRTLFKRPQLAIEIKVDESRAIKKEDSKRKRVLTPREKYKLMLEANPLVKDLVNRFDLTVDES